MIIAVNGPVLASLLLVACVVAGATSAGIVFLVMGPVLVRRDVARVPRGPIVSDTLFARPMLAGLSAHAQYSPVVMAQPQLSPLQMAPAAEMFEPQMPGDRGPAPQMFDPRPAPVAVPVPQIAPLKLRRPRTEQLELRRERMARGTPAPRFRDADVERTDEIPFFDVEEMTVPDDSRGRA